MAAAWHGAAPSLAAVSRCEAADLVDARVEATLDDKRVQVGVVGEIGRPLRFAIDSSGRPLGTRVKQHAPSEVSGAFVAGAAACNKAPGAKARRAPSRQLPAARRNGARPSANRAQHLVTSKPKEEATPNGRSGIEANNPSTSSRPASKPAQHASNAAKATLWCASPTAQSQEPARRTSGRLPLCHPFGPPSMQPRRPAARPSAATRTAARARR